MPHARSFALVLVASLFPLASGLPAAGLLGDAGSGADAGDSPTGAMALSYGSFEANQTFGDRDWFAFPPASTPACLSASAIAAHPMRVDVVVASAAVGSILDETGLFETVLAVRPASIHLGVVPDDAPWDALSVGPYAFSLDVAPPVLVGDRQHDDAGGTRATAEDLPGACFSGVFQADGPDVDVYAFQASAGERLTYSLATSSSAEASVSIRNASGIAVGAAVPSGGAGTIAVPETGTFYVRVESARLDESAPYAAALAVGPDPGSGCRPMCLSS